MAEAAFVALGALPGEGRGAGHVVAFRAGEALTQARFEREAAAWRDALAARPGARWALYFDDAVDFAAALVGAWHAGKVVVLPGDAQPDTIARLRASTDGFAGDLPGALARPDAGSAGATPWRPLDPAAARLVVHTSGTNGEPVGIEKHLAQLDAEVHALETRFGALCDSGLAPVNLAPELAAGTPDADIERTPATVWATVTHQHIYGLLFRVLWPLAAGRPFVAERLEYPEEIARALRAPAVLVASPAHLRRLPAHLDWSGARAALRAVFSSGGPLPPEAAAATQELLGAAPVEVYGSSETGGIAWRQRARHGDTWQPLPGVDFRIEDGELDVRSPHLPDAQWWRTADRAAPAADGMEGFELLGRADRIVKIEEKRVSLTALEQRLRETGDVADVRVLMLAAPSAGSDAGGTVASRPAVVAVLTEAGRACLRAQGKPALVARLRAALAQAVEPVALPRRWRFVEALPANAQGKSPEAMLAALFRPLRPALAWRAASGDASTACAEFDLDPALLVFDGHFPGRPILPGVAQVDWAIQWARERFALPARFVRLDTLKFQQPLEPGAHVEIEWRWDAAAGALHFEYRSALGRHSSGKAVFDVAGAADEGAPAARDA
jgi:acyl-coenzyme A synthetase/AMP-(fatty) acid ligase